LLLPVKSCAKIGKSFDQATLNKQQIFLMKWSDVCKPRVWST
jgi:hypothetical protein